MKTKKLALCATMVSLATVLLFASKALPAPWLQGGMITIGSMVPIIAVSLICDWKWGALSGLAFSLIQIIAGFYPPPAPSLINLLLVVFFDYVIAYTALGFAEIFYKLLACRTWAITVSGIIVTFIRYICHIISGILIWGVYAKEGQTVLAYSVTYNGSYMIPEIIITAVILALMSGVIKKYRFNFIGRN